MQAFYIDEWLEGEFLSFHDNGQLEEKSHYTKNCLNGEYKLWYSSGQLEMEGSYANGDIEIKVGEWKTYWENGKLKSREYYDRGWADRRYESYDWNNRYYLENGQPDIKRIEERNSIARLAGELSSM
jgi:antitoxin component YwqK of YwqJK toxin-antitoxin module